MPAFRYKAVAADGGAVSGTLEAESRAMALRRLVRAGLQPTEIAEAAPAIPVAAKKNRKSTTPSRSNSNAPTSSFLRKNSPTC